MDRNKTSKRNEFPPLAKFKTYKFKNYNFILLLFLICICGLGLVIIGSANSGDKSAILKQAMGMAVGLVGMLIVSLIDYNWILKFYWLIYIGNAALLAYTKLFGSTHHGAKRWIDIKKNVLTIQPSEFAKIFLILFFAKFLSMHKEKLNKWWFLFLVAVLAGIPLLLIVVEPDLSTTILITGILILLIFAAGLPYKKIAVIISVLIPISIAGMIYIQQPDQKLLDDYQLERILAFKYPEKYDSKRYQQDNSVLAIGSGKLYGKGLYNDSTESLKNNNYLSREAVNDFIFAVIGEEMGFVGSCIVLGLMFLIIIECYITAIFAPDFTGRLICMGVAIQLTLQTFINVGVATEILPNTGIPLPFISSGLSSLISIFGGLGFVFNVGLQKVRQ